MHVHLMPAPLITSAQWNNLPGEDEHTGQVMLIVAIGALIESSGARVTIHTHTTLVVVCAWRFLSFN